MKKTLLSLFFAFAAAAAIAADYSGTLPVMFIDTEGAEPITSKETYLNATYYIDNMGVEGFESIGSAEQPLALQIKGRGNYSWSGFDKKPYRIKLEKKADLLNLGSNRHFALLAHADDTYGFLRNTMGFYLSEKLGMPWTPGQQPVEVVLNGDYIGLYFLTETIRVDKDRVNITEQADLATDPEEITGGWLVEIDNYRDDPHILIKEGDGSDLIVTYKSPEELSPEQEQYLTGQISEINSQIYATNKEVCVWAEMVDIPTLAKYYIVQEIMDDYESFHGSCYLNKQRGEQEKWMFGPVWDFGSAFNYPKSQTIYQGREHHQTWIGEMCKFPVLMDEVKALWANFYETEYFDMLDYAQSFADYIAAAAKCDAKRWPKYGNADEQAKCDIVKKRLRGACAWLASQWGGTPQDPDLAPITLYYINSEANPWNRAFAYSWDDAPDGFYQLFGGWPGKEMNPTVLDGKGAYVITSYPTQEMSKAPGVLFDNGNSGNGNQTDDFVLVNGGVYDINGLVSGISDIAADSLEIKSVAGGIQVNAPGSCNLQIVTIDGIARTMKVNAGETVLPLNRGFYIVNGKIISVK